MIHNGYVFTKIKTNLSVVFAFVNEKKNWYHSDSIDKSGYNWRKNFSCLPQNRLHEGNNSCAVTVGRDLQFSISRIPGEWDKW